MVRSIINLGVMVVAIAIATGVLLPSTRGHILGYGRAAMDVIQGDRPFRGLDEITLRSTLYHLQEEERLASGALEAPLDAGGQRILTERVQSLQARWYRADLEFRMVQTSQLPLPVLGRYFLIAILLWTLARWYYPVKNTLIQRLRPPSPEGSPDPPELPGSSLNLNRPFHLEIPKDLGPENYPWERSGSHERPEFPDLKGDPNADAGMPAANPPGPFADLSQAWILPDLPALPDPTDPWFLNAGTSSTDHEAAHLQEQLLRVIRLLAGPAPESPQDCLGFLADLAGAAATTRTTLQLTVSPDTCTVVAHSDGGPIPLGHMSPDAFGLFRTTLARCLAVGPGPVRWVVGSSQSFIFLELSHGPEGLVLRVLDPTEDTLEHPPVPSELLLPVPENTVIHTGIPNGTAPGGPSGSTEG